MRTYYKYLSFGADGTCQRNHTLDVFENSRLYMPLYNQLNDPMEAFFESSDLTSRQVIEIKSTKQAIRLCCLSKTYTDILMWSHYGDGHKGCCVEVVVQPNSSCIKKHINYTQAILAPIGTSSHERSIDILSKKLQPWQYEREVRYLRDYSMVNNEFLDIRIKKVYLGCKLNTTEVEAYTQLINNACMYGPQIEILQLQYNQLTYWKNKSHPKISIF